MPRVVITHAVTDGAHWASKHSERVTAFTPWGTRMVDDFNAEHRNNVAVSVDVFDLAAMKKAIASPRSSWRSRRTGCSTRCRSTSRTANPPVHARR